MSVNTDYSSLSSTLASLRQEAQTDTTWSRVNTSLPAASLSRIIAEQKVEDFFKSSRLEKTDGRVQFAVEFCLKNPGKKLTEKRFEEITVATNDKIASLQTAFSVLTPLLSWSSKRMTQLMNWRNTESQAQSSKVRVIVNVAKRAATELVLPFIAVSALVESVATKLLSLAAKVGKRDTARLDAIYKSALFTTVWAGSTVYHNVKQKVLSVEESTARRALFKGYFKA